MFTSFRPLQSQFVALACLFLIFFGSSSFFLGPQTVEKENTATRCNPDLRKFNGYTFLRPDIIDPRTAYAPFFLEWGDFYRDSFLTIDWFKKENMEEWSSRFCDLPDPAEVATVVNEVSARDLLYLREMVVKKSGSTDLGWPFTDNSFAQCIVYNGCVDVVDYLLYARSCEIYALPRTSKWRLEPPQLASMQLLIQTGKSAFDKTDSHFLKMRYLYQMVRLAHYAKQYQQVIALYNEYMPHINQKRQSVVFFWIMAHSAGALQKLGYYDDAAYRFAVVFRNCASKRTAAYESFALRNDADWAGALKRCQNDPERATLYLLRAGKYRATAVSDLREVLKLDPANPQLPLLLVSEIQLLEKLMLYTPMTDKKYGVAKAALRRQDAAVHLIELQDFVRAGIRNGQVDNPILWRSLSGYLEVLAGDYYSAEKSFKRAEQALTDSDHDKILFRQIEIWRIVADMRQLDTGRVFDYATAYNIPKRAAFKDHWDFEPYMNDLMSSYYIADKHPGKGLLTAYGPEALLYNPDLVVIEDLLREANSGNDDFLRMTERYDTSAGRRDLIAQLIEVKAMTMLNQGHPEAALLTLRNMDLGQKEVMKRFQPFHDTLLDLYNTPFVDSLNLTRLEFLEKIFDYEMKAKAAEAMNEPIAAWYYYLIGLGYYNTSFFGYGWEVRDYLHDGRNWSRLAQGPVFPLEQSPAGNFEVTDLTRALEYFQKALALSFNPELSSRAAFMAARCQQKQWFCDPLCSYKPGSKLIPRPPTNYYNYYRVLLEQYPNTQFTQLAIRECKWLAAYSKGG